MKKAVTLIEVIVTVIIISILVMVALPSFSRMHESSLDKEAFGSLKRMQEAARLYNMEFSQYYPSTGTGLVTNISNINRNLKISLSTAADPNWNYAVKDEAAGTCVQATRNGDDGRIWRLEINDTADAPTLPSAACP